ncbi:N,N-dimethylformamidase beta subunit family domain-containing protein [Leeia oryzae]|uniref:N,N-dimethylformamidase beta subunit family domain-containing protein n=1 Tax=Leeia oryzae TaxID=356662 RepID=UPI0003767BC8|nr:N,N-dimethylformamidase beta subunit family domain-containing protein [Leeia oryzae]
MHSETDIFPDFGLTAEQRRAAVFSHYYEYPGMDGEKGEIWCYTDAYTYTAGATVQLKISATAAKCHMVIIRDGAQEVPVLSHANIDCGWQETPDQCSVTGCGWETSLEFQIPDSWTSGAYRITLTATGKQGNDVSCDHLFIVRPAAGQHAGRILQVAATGTWTAYNTWGGSNHYEGITGPERNQFSPLVSTQRPFARGFVRLPAGSPRVPLEKTLPPKTLPRYPHMEWAYANGFSKKYASSGWASYDSHFFRWAERAGYQIDLCSQHELQFHPEILDGYDCVVCVGHDEYWTWEMRDAIDAYVANGGHIARFAGNFMWQTRLSDDGTQQTCYKYRARAEDPMFRSNPSRTTNSWEAPEISRPGSSTFGLNATNGVYVGWGGCAVRGVRGFPVYRPEHWAFAGTGIYYGDLLGADSHVFGYEVDGLDYVIKNGLPEPAPGAGAPESLQILALGMASLIEESADITSPDQFLKDDDCKFVAETLYGYVSEASMDKVKRGAGMIVNFPQGKGEVFHAGSCEWVAGLLKQDAMVEQVTRNVLNRYLGLSKS